MTPINLDPSSLTIGDLAEFEKITGSDLFELLPTSAEEAASFRPSARVLMALVYLVRRKVDPSFTLEDAGEVEIGALEFETPDPTKAAG